MSLCASGSTTLRRYQCDLISGLLPAEEADSLISAFVSDLERLAVLLTAVLTTQCMRKWWATGKLVGTPTSAVLNQQGLPAASLDAREFLRAERAAQPQVDEGFLTRCCNSCWCNIRANVWW
ncbi:hypothetical protein ACNKHR_11115 [Shigella flexneri]